MKIQLDRCCSNRIREMEPASRGPAFQAIRGPSAGRQGSIESVRPRLAIGRDRPSTDCNSCPNWNCFTSHRNHDDDDNDDPAAAAAAAAAVYIFHPIRGSTNNSE